GRRNGRYLGPRRRRRRRRPRPADLEMTASQREPMSTTTSGSAHPGPLRDLKVVEMAALGPVPFCGMLFSDLGADVLRIDREGGRRYDAYSVETRGRRSVVLDLKTPRGRDTALALIEKADALIEGFRPGVMERLGLG